VLVASWGHRFKLSLGEFVAVPASGKLEQPFRVHQYWLCRHDLATGKIGGWSLPMNSGPCWRP
jgi:hypothetical protein